MLRSKLPPNLPTTNGTRFWFHGLWFLTVLADDDCAPEVAASWIQMKLQYDLNEQSDEGTELVGWPQTTHWNFHLKQAQANEMPHFYPKKVFFFKAVSKLGVKLVLNLFSVAFCLCLKATTG